MNYDAFMEPVTWFLTGMEKHSDGRNDDLLGDAGKLPRCHEASHVQLRSSVAGNGHE